MPGTFNISMRLGRHYPLIKRETRILIRFGVLLIDTSGPGLDRNNDRRFSEWFGFSYLLYIRSDGFGWDGFNHSWGISIVNNWVSTKEQTATYMTGH